MLRRAAGDAGAIANTLGWLSFVVAASGDLPRAIRLAREGVDMARQHGDARTIAQALTRLGTHLTMDGDAESGAPLLEEAAELARQSGDLFTAAAALDSLGAAERLRGNSARAISVLTEDMRLVDEIGYGITAAEVRYHLADTFARTGDIEQRAQPVPGEPAPGARRWGRTAHRQRVARRGGNRDQYPRVRTSGDTVQRGRERADRQGHSLDAGRTLRAGACPAARPRTS